MKHKIELKRTHDLDLYLKENRYDKPKEITKIISKKIGNKIKNGGATTALDIGCAAGEFVYHLHRQYPALKIDGVEPIKALIQKAKKINPSINFIQGSAENSKLLPKNTYDIITMQGVLSLFEDYQPSLSNIIKWLKPGGEAWVFGVFNPFPYDVWLQYRDYKSKGSKEFGWNMFSMTGVSNYLKTIGAKKITFETFTMPFEIKKNSKDLLRTWTIARSSSHSEFTNGLSINVNLKILNFTKPS